MVNKQHHSKVLFNSFPMNGHTFKNARKDHVGGSVALQSMINTDGLSTTEKQRTIWITKQT